MSRRFLFAVAELPTGGAAIFTESGAFKALDPGSLRRVGLELSALSTVRRAGAACRRCPRSFRRRIRLTSRRKGLVDPDLYRRTLPPVLDDESFGSVLLGIILTDATTTRLKLPPIVECDHEH